MKSFDRWWDSVSWSFDGKKEAALYAYMYGRKQRIPLAIIYGLIAYVITDIVLNLIL